MGIGLDLFALRRDGSEFPGGDQPQPHRAGDGRGLVAAAIRDVTDRMRVEQADPRPLRAVADRANLGKSRFLATASHDLRQPLQALALLNAHIAAPGRQRRCTRRAGAAGRRPSAAMSRLLNALLDVSKLESGAIKPDITDFKVAAAAGGDCAGSSPSARREQGPASLRARRTSGASASARM